MIAILDTRLIDRLRRAQRLMVFTGAGMSAESGIPTFRDRLTGLWAHTDPTEVATPQAFRSNPQRVWDWHVHVASAVSEAQPNAGHRAIAELAGKALRVSVITQNIDSLHQAAGSREVIELHGNLFRPDVVWFNEMLDPDVLDAAMNAVDGCDAMLCIGSSLEVEPAASLPWRALRRGATVVEVNPQPTALTPHVTAFSAPAAQALPELFAVVWG